MRIALVEPSAIVRECLALLLRARRESVTPVGTLRDAEAVLDVHGFDLLILEPNVASGGGLELLRKVRQDPRLGRMPVLVLTDSSDKSEILRIIETGVSQCVLKSDFSVRSFLRRVASAAVTHPTPMFGPVEDRAEPKANSSLRSKLQSMRDAIQGLKELRPLIEPKALADRIAEVSELRALSPTVAQIIKLTNRPDTSIDTLIRAVRTDQAIALKVIRIANSSAFARGDPVSSVKDAVLRIGTDSIRQVATNIGIIEQFSETGVLSVSSAEFWEHSIGVGITASEIARRTGAVESDAAFTMGLLHDVGRLLLAEAVPDVYGQIIEQAESLALPLEQVERRMLLSTHAGIMQGVLASWSVPKDLIDPIVGHHLGMSNIRSEKPGSVTPMAIVALSNRIIHALGIGCSGNRAVYPTEEFFEALGLPGGTLTQIAGAIPEMVEDLKLAMLSDTSSNSSISQFSRSLYISSSPDTDAIGVMFQQRDENRESFDPLFAVVRFRSERERSRLTQVLVERERGCELDPLPVVLLSPNGDIQLQENHMHRPHVLLPTPVATSRLIAGIGHITGQSDAERLRPTGAAQA